MSQVWNGNAHDRSGIAIFTEDELNAEVPLDDVQMFHALCAVIDAAKRVARLQERKRLRNAMITVMT